MKHCFACGKDKDESSFYKNSKTKDGLQTQCIECVKSRSHTLEFRKREREIRKERISDPYQREKENARRRVWKKQYWASHPEMRVIENSRDSTVARFYRQNASRRGIEWELTKDEFSSFRGRPCEYCGEILDRPRIDRLDSTIGYTIENCVPCCYFCNISKNVRSPEQFKEWIRRAYKWQTNR